MARTKRKNWPITFVDERMVAPARLFRNETRDYTVRVFCIEHTDQGDVAHAELSIGLYSFPLSDLKPCEEKHEQENQARQTR